MAKYANTSFGKRKCLNCNTLMSVHQEKCPSCGWGNEEFVKKKHELENYITVEDFAMEKDDDVNAIIDMLKAGFYKGKNIDGKWYVDKSESLFD